MCVSEVPVIINYFFGNKTIKLMLKKKKQRFTPTKNIKGNMWRLWRQFQKRIPDSVWIIVMLLIIVQPAVITILKKGMA